VPYSQFIPWLSQHGLDMDLFMRSRSSSLSSASGKQLVSDTCGCPSLLLSSLASHSDYRYFFTCGNAVSMQPSSNQAMQPTAGPV
jgi:hypothetical protein